MKVSVQIETCACLVSISLKLLLRNINPAGGLCNGTRLIIKNIFSRLIEAEIDVGESKIFEIIVQNFEQDDIFCLTVDNIPEYNIEDSFEEIYQGRLAQTSDNYTSMPNLNIWLAPTPSKAVYDMSDVDGRHRLEPKMFRNEYAFTLRASNGFSPGKYSLFVWNCAIDESTQAVRVGYKIHKAIRAKSVKDGDKIVDVIGADEISHFRYVINDPSKLVTITVKPMSDGQGEIKPIIFL